MFLMFTCITCNFYSNQVVKLCYLSVYVISVGSNQVGYGLEYGLCMCLSYSTRVCRVDTHYVLVSISKFSICIKVSIKCEPKL